MPCDADPLPDPQAHHTVAGFVHSSDNLMARNDRHLVRREIPLDNVKDRCGIQRRRLLSPGPRPARLAARPFLVESAAAPPRASLRQDHRAHSTDHLLRW